MGFPASQAMLMAMIARKSNLELEAQLINQHRMYLGNMVSGLFNLQGKLEPNTKAFNVLQARIQMLQNADKILEMQLNRIKSQQEAVTAEIEGTKKIISGNIRSSFGLLGNR